jgi:hypothetical protein
MVAKVSGICRELADLRNDPLAANLLAHVQASDVSGASGRAYLAWSRDLASWRTQGWMVSNDGLSDLANLVIRLSDELIVFGYFIGTVCEFFDEGLSRERFARALAPAEPWGIERLAMARQAMAFSPRTAAARIDEFREAWRLK